MSKSANKKSISEQDFVIMGRTRELLAEIWDLWRKDLQHTPDAAKAMIVAGLKEFHQAEAGVQSATKKKVKSAQKATKAVAKKTTKALGLKATKKTGHGRKKAK